MSKIEFENSNVEPKFEFSDDPEHVLSKDDLRDINIDRYGTYLMLNSSSRVPPRRIRALRDFGDVKKGDLGGFLQNPDYLDHAGNCWIYDDACVLARREKSHDGTPLVRKPTFLTGNAKLYDQVVFIDGRIQDDVTVVGDVCCDGVVLSGRTRIRRRRLPYVLRGKIHNNRRDGDAQRAISDAEHEEFWDSRINNPNLWNTIKDNYSHTLRYLGLR